MLLFYIVSFILMIIAIRITKDHIGRFVIGELIIYTANDTVYVGIVMSIKKVGNAYTYLVNFGKLLPESWKHANELRRPGISEAITIIDMIKKIKSGEITEEDVKEK
jgi:hypothetical protein